MSVVKNKLKNLNNDFKGTDGKEYGDFEQLPAGKYEIQVKHKEFAVSQKGNILLTVSAKIIEGKFKGRNIKTDHYITEGTMPYFKKIAEGLGFSGGNLDELEEFDFIGNFYTAQIELLPGTDGNNYPRIVAYTAKAAETAF